MARMRTAVKAIGFLFGCMMIFAISALVFAGKDLPKDWVLLPLFVAGTALLMALVGVIFFGWRVVFGGGEESHEARAPHKHTPHPKCPVCLDRSAPVRCEAHGEPLCIGCMFRHDVPGVCFYTPDSDRRASFRAKSPEEQRRIAGRARYGASNWQEIEAAGK